MIWYMPISQSLQFSSAQGPTIDIRPFSYFTYLQTKLPLWEVPLAFDPFFFFLQSPKYALVVSKRRLNTLIILLLAIIWLTLAPFECWGRWCIWNHTVIQMHQQSVKTKAILSSPMPIKTRGGAFLRYVHICCLCGCDECKLDPPSSQLHDTHSLCKLDFKTLDAGTRLILACILKDLFDTFSFGDA